MGGTCTHVPLGYTVEGLTANNFNNEYDYVT